MNYEKILKDNEKMIWKMTTYFYGIDKNDLFQAGVVGLLKALKNYQNNGTTKFSSYAYDYIYGEMYLTANNKNIKVSKDILSLYKKIEETRYVLAQKWHKVPNNYELASFLEIPLEEIDMACGCATTIMSLDSDLDDKNIYDKIPINDKDIDTKIFLEDGINTLNEEEQNIIKSRYFDDLTQSEVAKKLKMTQVMVSRYEKKGIDKLRSYMTM